MLCAIYIALAKALHMAGDPEIIRGRLKPEGLFLNEVQGYMSEEAKAEVRALVDDVVAVADGGFVETVRPDDPMERTRLDRLGFGEAGPRLQRNVTAAGAAARRPS